MAAKSFGQTINFEFDHYSANEGLSNGYITTMLQDSKGFIWIGTANGLNRFDGISFKTYYFDLNDSASISGSLITSMAEDSLENIWIMTSGGFCVFDKNTDVFARKTLRVNGIKLNRLYINACYIDSKGYFWISSSSGIYRFKLYDNPQISGGMIDAEMYLLVEDDVDQVYKNYFYSFVEDKDGKIWVASYSNKLFFFDSRQNRFIPQPINHPDAEQLSNIRKLLFKDDEGDFFITMEEKGLLVWYREKNKFSFYKPDGGNAGPKGNILYALAEDKNGLIWIGDRNSEGISIFDKKTERFQNIRSAESNPYSLISNKITFIYRDKANSMWVGTIIGISKYSPGKLKFKRYFSDPVLPDKLSFNNVLCFAEGKTGDIWIGTDGGGLNRLDRKTGKFIHFVHDQTNPNGLSSNAIISLCEDHEGTLWMGTFDGGLAKMKDNKFSAIYPDSANPCSISDKNIWSVLEDSKNNLWVGTLRSGLDLFDRKTNRFYHYTNRRGDSTSIANNYIIELYEDSRQNLYIIGNQGVSIIDLNAVDFSKVPPVLASRNLLHDENKNSISSNDVYCVKEDNEGNIWFGTVGSGIDKLEPSTGKFTNYSIKDGLPGNYVSSILVDQANNLWLATDKGLAEFDPETKKVTVFDLKDGLQNRSLKGWAIKTRDGEMFFGGTNGFNSFYPEQIKNNLNKNEPPVVITGLRIFNKQVKINEKINNRTILTRDISETDALELTYKENFFTFEFIALDYMAPEKNNYAYMMEGFDKEWIHSGTKHEANYTNLDPGTYVFRVKASNNDGLWNEEGTSIKILIRPPWWKTLVFRISFVVAIIILIFSLFYSRIRQLRNQKILLEETVVAKTAELKELNASKDKFFSIIAHDLKNPFNAIIGFSELLYAEAGKEQYANAGEYAMMINTSAVQTLKLLENLLEWAKTQRGNISFNPVSINLSDAVTEEMITLDGNAKSKNIELKNSVHSDLMIIADRNMIRTIFRNLISNAIKFTRRDGKIEVKASTKNNTTEISVSDNGIGMTKEMIAKLFRIETNFATPGTENEKGTGLGLILCKEFVEKHGGKIWVESETGKGSAFIFTLPLKTGSSS
ncbi:MAG: two-component regulator propeller domain-containing protein [Bacteroidota bacterium]